MVNKMSAINIKYLPSNTDHQYEVRITCSEKVAKKNLCDFD